MALLAVTCGVAVSTIYLPQPLLGLIADGLHISSGSAGSLATAVQLGYAVGILFLVPLGDRIFPRRLVPGLLVVTAALLLAASFATSLGVLATLLVVAGVTAVVPQILIPLAGRLAGPDRIGRVSGILATGLVSGIFGGRVVAGVIGQSWGWTGVFRFFAALCVVMSIAMVMVLPDERPPLSRSYGRLLAELPGLVRAHRSLRQAAYTQFFTFAAFNATWSVLTLHLTSEFGWSTRQAGLFGLVGLAGGLLTPLAGAQIDRRGPVPVIGACLSLVVASLILVFTADTVLIALAVGLFLLTVGTQSAQVAHQTRIFAAAPQARGGVNTVYMFATFLGGSMGAQVAANVFDSGGLRAVVVADAIFVALALLGFAAARRPEHSRPASSAADTEQPKGLAR